MWLDSFRARVDAHPDRAAIVMHDRATSYRELWEGSKAAGLAASRATPGPRQLIAHEDPRACLEGIIGAWMHGQVPVTVAPDMPGDAMGHIREMIKSTPLRAQDPQDREALVLTTSGSTGLPKMCVLPHRSLDTGLPAVAAWYGQPDEAQVMIAGALHLTRTLINNALLGLIYGWTLHPFPGGTPSSVLQAHIRSHGITVLNGPSSLFRLFFQYGVGSTFPSLRHISAAGEPVPAAVVDQMLQVFPRAVISIAYGSTEAGTRVSQISSDDPRSRIGGVGVPLPHVQTRIVPVAGGEGPAGELLVRSSTVFLGYLKPDGSYAGLDAEGFLHTGDLMRSDPDGCLFHLGRIGGLVKVGGLQVNPLDVEQALRALPGVLDAMCWAEPHELLGYTIAAMVVPKPGAALDERSLRAECGSRLEKHKVPRTIAIVDKFPETPAGKRSLKPT